MPIEHFLWVLTVVALKDAIKPKHLGCVICPEHITLHFEKVTVLMTLVII